MDGRANPLAGHPQHSEARSIASTDEVDRTAVQIVLIVLAIQVVAGSREVLHVHREVARIRGEVHFHVDVVLDRLLVVTLHVLLVPGSGDVVVPEEFGIDDVLALAVAAPVEAEDVEAFVVESLGEPGPIAGLVQGVADAGLVEEDDDGVAGGRRGGFVEEPLQANAVRRDEVFFEGLVLSDGPRVVAQARQNRDRGEQNGGSHPASHGNTSKAEGEETVPKARTYWDHSPLEKSQQRRSANRARQLSISGRKCRSGSRFGQSEGVRRARVRW